MSTYRRSQGTPDENWAAVAHAIGDRLRELGWRQRDLAERSHVSVAVIREIQRHTVERRRNHRTLKALSVALGWEPEHLHQVLNGHAQQSGGHARPGSAARAPRTDGSAEGMSKQEPRAETTVKLLNLLDIEHGTSLRAESTLAAVRVARELSEGMTRAQRIAVHEFLTDVANAVRWPQELGGSLSAA